MGWLHEFVFFSIKFCGGVLFIIGSKSQGSNIVFYVLVFSYLTHNLHSLFGLKIDCVGDKTLSMNFMVILVYIPSSLTYHSIHNTNLECVISWLTCVDDMALAFFPWQSACGLVYDDLEKLIKGETSFIPRFAKVLIF